MGLVAEPNMKPVGNSTQDVPPERLVRKLCEISDPLLEHHRGCNLLKPCWSRPRVHPSLKLQEVVDVWILLRLSWPCNKSRAPIIPVLWGPTHGSACRFTRPSPQLPQTGWPCSAEHPFLPCTPCWHHTTFYILFNLIVTELCNH